VCFNEFEVFCSPSLPHRQEGNGVEFALQPALYTRSMFAFLLQS
jgi:hypothetical protein